MSKQNESERLGPSQFYPRLEGIARRLEGVARDLADVLAQVAGRGVPVVPGSGEVSVNGTRDRMLTVAEVAARMGISKDYAYHKAKTWPFRRKLSARALRFSEAGLEQWLKENRPNGTSAPTEMHDRDEEPAVGDVLVFPMREPAA